MFISFFFVFFYVSWTLYYYILTTHLYWPLSTVCAAKMDFLACTVVEKKCLDTAITCNILDILNQESRLTFQEGDFLPTRILLHCALLRPGQNWKLQQHNVAHRTSRARTSISLGLVFLVNNKQNKKKDAFLCHSDAATDFDKNQQQQKQIFP